METNMHKNEQNAFKIVLDGWQLPLSMYTTHNHICTIEPAETKVTNGRDHSLIKFLISHFIVPSISDFSGDTIAGTFPEEVIFFVKVAVIFTYGNGETFFLKVGFLLFTDGGFLQHLKELFLSWNKLDQGIQLFNLTGNLSCLKKILPAVKKASYIAQHE